MYNKINIWLYPKELRDFINHDLKIKVTKNNRYYQYNFESKREVAIFKIVHVPLERPLSQLDLYQFADAIFFEILTLKENDEIF